MDKLDKLDISKYSEILCDLTCFGYQYKLIYEKASTKTDNLDQNYRFIYYKESFLVKDIKSGEFVLFFHKPKRARYHNLNKEQEPIFSTLQIDDYMKSNEIDDLIFYWDSDEVHYSAQKVYLKHIKEDDINFQVIKVAGLNSENFELNTEFLKSNTFPPLKFSNYFFDYFQHNSDTEKEFIYYETHERNALMELLQDFCNSTLNYFKFCGPISGGKSTTLLKFTNENEGVIYFNLKTIKKYYLNGDKKFKLIMKHELRRITIKEQKFKDIKIELEKILDENEVLETIFMKLVDFLILLKTRNILILDQFKINHFEIKTLNEMTNKIFKTKVGLILSSSIDEEGIKTELQLTLSKLYKMPKKILADNQHYYFYVPDLLKDIIKNKYVSQKEISEEHIELYEQFSFKTKYISLLEKEGLDNGIKKIKNLITQKMVEKVHIPEPTSLEFIFLLINNYIDKNLEFTEENINLLRKIPLKFINIQFEEKKFSLHYGFPYIKTLMEESKKNLDTKKYFEAKMYENSFYSQFKGPYFEGEVIRAILSGKFYNKIDNNENIFKITVNNILNMGEDNTVKNAYTIIQTW